MTSPKKVVVRVMSDVACPWCWVGKRAIETAAANINAEEPNSIALELHWEPFQLSPDLPTSGPTRLRIDRLVEIIGSRAKIEEWISNPDSMPMNQSCKQSGLKDIAFRMTAQDPLFNTYQCHQLLTHTGKVLGDYTKQNALKEAMLRMAHGEGKNLSDRAELLAAAREAGVASTAEEVDKILADANVKQLLDVELKGARGKPDFGGVPYFTMPDGNYFSGGQPVGVFEKMLKGAM